MQGGIDPISVWIVSLLEPMGWQGLWSPIRLPHPMNDYIFRPLSILLVKGGFWLAGESLVFPAWLIGLKAVLVSGGFAIGAWLWLRDNCSEWLSTGLICLALCFDSSIFTAYNFTEFDGLGAGLILGASWALRNRRWWAFTTAALLAIFLKESIAISVVLFLAPQFLLDWRRGTLSIFGLGILGGLLLLWGIGVSPILLGKVQSGAGQLNLGGRASILWYTWLQVLILCTETGVILLLGAVFYQRKQKVALILMGAFLLWAMIEPMGMINHFQTYYFSRTIYASVLLLALLVVLCGWIWRGTEAQRLFSLQILCVFGGFSFIILISSNLREDLASRLFLVFLPGFLLFVWQAVQKIWTGNRFLTAFLYLGHVWAIGISGWNMASEILFEQSKLESFYRMVSEQLQEPATLLFSDMNRPLNIKYLSKFEEKNSKNIQMARIEYYPKQAQLPSFLRDWNLSLTQEKPVYFWHQYSQVRLPAEELTWLQADFSWIRGGVDQGSHAPIGFRDSFHPEHSLLEDLYRRRYPTEESNLDLLLESDFQRLIFRQKGYYTLSTRLIEVPLRWLNGISVLEPRSFTQELWIRK